MTKRGGPVLRGMAILTWAIWVVLPPLHLFGRLDVEFPFWVWFIMMFGVFFLSTLAWPIEKKRERSDRDNGSG